MQTDKNKPFTWRAYKSSLCSSCIATCCTMPLEIEIDDLISMGLAESGEIVDLTKKGVQKLIKRLKAQGLIKSYRESTGLILMESKPNGDCLYLNEQRLCKIYENRPKVCRLFPEKKGLRPGFCPYVRKSVRKSLK